MRPARRSGTRSSRRTSRLSIKRIGKCWCVSGSDLTTASRSTKDSQRNQRRGDNHGVLTMRKLLLALLIAVEPAGCYELAPADTVTIGYFDPAAVDANLGIKVLATTTAPVTTMSPIILNTGLPIFLGGNPANPSTQFGFDAIGATVIPPGGNVISGGIPGAVLPTFEFFFNDGFVPPSGGSIYLYATWQGTLDAHGVPSITLPTQWGTDEMPKNAQGLTVTTQVLVCNTPNPFCGPFVGGIAPLGFGGQDQFADTLRVDNVTLSPSLPGVGIES